MYPCFTTTAWEREGGGRERDVITTFEPPNPWSERPAWHQCQRSCLFNATIIQHDPFFCFRQVVHSLIIEFYNNMFKISCCIDVSLTHSPPSLMQIKTVHSFYLI
jgi:hypothetical protein